MCQLHLTDDGHVMQSLLQLRPQVLADREKDRGMDAEAGGPPWGTCRNRVRGIFRDREGRR